MSGPPKERIFFGSLELKEKEIREKPPYNANANSNALPNVLPLSTEPEVLPFSERTLEAMQRQQRVVEEMEIKKKARTLNVPTDDRLVQTKLRELGEPILFFGEQPPERRERLKDILVRKGIDDAMPTSLPSSYAQSAAQQQDELFYTEGSVALKAARIAITKYSVAKTKERLIQQKKRRELEDNVDWLVKEDARLNTLYGAFEGFNLVASQVGDDRPLSYCTFLPDSEHLITTSWNGACKMWRAKDSAMVQLFNGHTDRATSMVPHPSCMTTQSKSALNFASSGFDKMVMLWSMDNSAPLAVLKGHQHRVNRVAFHPTGKWLGSASTDLSWKLWDVETGKELIDQEGHSRAITSIAFQPDGALVFTGGEDLLGRVWDLRSGKSILVLRGHSKKLICADWALNGYQVATAGEDNTVRIWDMRKKRLFYTIPAHNNSVSTVRFHPDGDLLLTASFDNTIKLWSPIDWIPVKMILGNEGKIMSADMSPNMQSFVTANYDRTWRLFVKTKANASSVVDSMQIDENNTTTTTANNNNNNNH